MNTATNIGLQAAATILITAGVSAITTNIWQGTIEIILGIVAYGVYEFTPSSNGIQLHD